MLLRGHQGIPVVISNAYQVLVNTWYQLLPLASDNVQHNMELISRPNIVYTRFTRLDSKKHRYASEDAAGRIPSAF